MRFLFIALLALASVAQARDLSLECTLKYDIDDMDKVEISRLQSEDDTINFFESNDNVVTYFFTDIAKDSRRAIWHNDAKYRLKASVVGDVLTINYQFDNYLREETEVVNVFNETRQFKIDFDEIDDDEEQSFDFSDGDIISSKINNDDWINQDGLRLDGCTLTDLDLIKKEEIYQTRRQRRRANRVPFWVRIFEN